MAAPELLRLGALGLLLSAALACAGSPAPRTATTAAPASQPAAAPAAPPPQAVAPPLPPPPPAEEPVGAVPHRGTAPVVIDSGESAEEKDPGLAAAARAERARRAFAPPPALTITDRNLKDHATGSLTIASGPPPAPEGEAGGTASEVRDEQYWRRRVREVRERWALAVEAIAELEERAASLRTRFYAADDPYVRDSQIKPSWDQALQNLDAARERARELELELQATLDEGRRAGALPGWLREGIELEPTDHPYDRPDPKEPVEGELVGEPVIVDEGGPPQ